MNYKTILLLIIFCPMSLWAQKTESSDTLKLTLTEVIQKLKKDNLNIKASEYEVSKAQKERKANKGLYYPKLDVGATFTKMSDALELDLTPVRDAILPAYTINSGQNQVLQQIAGGNSELSVALDKLNTANEQAISAINNGEWHKTIQEDQFAVVDASLKWALFTGGKIRAANNAAEARLEERKAKSNKVIAGEITSVVERYFGLRLSMNVAQVRKKVVDGMEKHLHDAKKMEENGMIAHAERLHAEVALVEAKREYKKANNRIELMQTALKNSLSTNQPVDPATDLFITTQTDNLNNFVTNAQNMNPAIKQLQAKEKLASQAIKKEKSAWYPDVFAFGQADIVNYQLSEYMPEWMVGVGLKLNVFDGLQKLRNTQAAKMQKLQVQAYQDKVKQDLATGVTKIYQKIEQAAENYESTLTSIKFAKEYLRIRKKAFNEGFATSTDVVDAQLNLAKVETEKLKAMYKYDVALAKLLELSHRSEEITNFASK